MGIFESMKAVLDSTGPRNRPADGSKGAYWCDDCDVRIRDVDLEGEQGAKRLGQSSGEQSDPRDGDPVCPDCGEEMRFERSTGRSCAC